MPLRDSGTDNHACPRFVALVFDEFVEADESLDKLLAILTDLADPNDPEDVCVWEGHRLAAVVQGDGRVTRFDQAPEPAPADATRAKRPRRTH